MKTKLLKLAMLFAIVITIFTLPQICKAETYGDYTYTVSNGEVSITDFSTSVTGAIEIPSEIDGYPVTSIGNRAFYNCSSLTSVIIPDSVTSIGNYAFEYCSSLTSVTIPDSVTSIGYCAFEDCSSLEKINYNAVKLSSQPSYSSNIFSNAGTSGDGIEVIFGDSVEEIPQYLFYSNSSDNPNIKTVTIGKSVTSIGSSAFEGCTSLTSVTIPDSVTSIGDEAFYGCSSLTSVTIPDSVTSIGSSAFKGCSSLTSVIIPDSVTSIGNYAFEGCSSLTSITIPDSVTSISSFAFEGCSSLTSITIPDSVTSIRNSAFKGCSSLTSVTIPDLVTSIGSSAFSGCTSLTSVTIPDLVTSIDSSAFFACSSLTSITIPDSVTSIGSSAFYGCSSLTFVTIPDSVTYIGSSAFEGCTSLKKINYNAVKLSSQPSSSSKIFSHAGTSGDGIEVIFGDSVEEIPDYLFYSARNIKTVAIGKSVTSIGDSAFYYCTSLEKINYNAVKLSSLPSDGSDIFCYAGTSGDGIEVIFGDSVEEIPQYLFYVSKSSYKPNIKTVTIGKSVTSIGDSAFYNCTSLEKINYNAVKLSIIPTSDSDIFYNTGTSGGGIEVIFGDSVEEIPQYLFYVSISLYKPNIKTVTIGKSVTSIGMSAFGGCSSLEEITLPFVGSNRDANKTVDSVFGYIFGYSESSSSTAIRQYYSDGRSAYYYIPKSLKKVTVTDDLTIPYGAFYNCSTLTSVTIPDSVTNIDGYAFYNCSTLTSVTIPDSVTGIGNYAFYNCYQEQTKLNLPNTLTSIGKGAFCGWESLEEIVIPFIGSKRGISGTEDAVFGYIFGTEDDLDTSQQYMAGTYEDYTIPITLRKVTITDETVIPYGAFSNCSFLTDIVIEGTPSTVMANAFSGFYNLFNVTIKSKSTRFTNSNIFEGSEFPTLYGYSGSTTETYAEKYDIYFIPLDDPEGSEYQITGNAQVMEEKIVVYAKTDVSVSGKNLHIALYNNSSKLIDYIIVPSSCDFSEVNVVFKDNPEAKYAKIFLWDSVTSLEPVAKAVKVDVVR